MLELIRVAGSAEVLRLRLVVRRHGGRVAQAIVAVVFVLYAFVLLELSAVVALEPRVGLLYALLLVGAANLMLAGLLLWLASRDRPSLAEGQALEVRREAIASLRSAGVMMALLQWGWRLARNSKK